MNKITVKLIGEDWWGRKIYQNVDNNNKYKLVDNTLYTFTKDGEPCCPIRDDIKVIYIN